MFLSKLIIVDTICDYLIDERTLMFFICPFNKLNLFGLQWGGGESMMRLGPAMFEKIASLLKALRLCVQDGKQIEILRTLCLEWGAKNHQ